MKMYEVKQSDDVIVPKNVANKGAEAPAELREGRTSIKENPQDQSTGRTPGWGTVHQTVERIRQAAKRNPKERLTALLYHQHRLFCPVKFGLKLRLPRVWN